MPNPKANQQPLDLDRIKADAMSMGIPARALLDMIYSGGRSAIATTAGLPADLANTAIGLHNMAHDIRRNKFEGYQPGSISGGSEDIKGLIPDLAKDPNSMLNKMASTAGDFAVIPGAGTAATKGAKMLGQEIADRVATGQRLIPGVGEPQMAMHVIKPEKGGNWVNKQVNSALDKLKQDTLLKNKTYYYGPEHDKAVEERIKELKDIGSEGGLRVVKHLEDNKDKFKKLGALNQWIDTNLKNYVRNDMATPHDPIRLGIEERVAKVEANNAKEQKKIAKLDEKIAQAKQSGDEGAVRTMQAARDNLAIEAEDAYELGMKHSAHVPHENFRFGDNISRFEGMSTTKPSNAWEFVSDNALDRLNSNRLNDPYEQHYKTISKEQPELLGLKDKNIYSVSDPRNFANDLGFDHVVDTIKQHLDLPEGDKYHLKPEQLKNISVPQMMERVANQNLEKDIASRNVALQQQEGFPVLKEYPSGHKWIELKMPDPKIEESHVMGHPSGYPDLHAVIDSKTGQSVSVGSTPEEAVNLYKREERQKQLEDALTYEGDKMGHCVGGYCPDVLQGNTRIFSLRDKRGEPHVTIEARNPKIYTEDDVLDQFPGGVTDALKRGDIGAKKYIASKLEELNANSRTPNIHQIKGKGNGAPVDKYLPMVQDFQRTTGFPIKGDIQNSGFVNTQPELKKFGESIGLKVPDYLTKDEENVLRQQVAPHVESTVKNANNFLDTHPAFEPHRQANEVFNSALNNGMFFKDEEQYSKLRNASNQPLHPDIPYTYNEFKSVLNNPEEHGEGDPLKTQLYTLGKIDELRNKVGDVPAVTPQETQGLAKGGRVKRKVHVANDLDMMRHEIQMKDSPKGFAGGGVVDKMIGKGMARLFSAVDKTAAELPRAKGTGAEFMTELSKKPGVKKAELADRNLDEIKALPKMTKDEFKAELAKRPVPQVTKKILSENNADKYYIEPVDPDMARPRDPHWLYDENWQKVNEEPFMTRHDAQSYVNDLKETDNNIPRYSSYKLPGGDNYQEHLYQLSNHPEEYESSHWEDIPNVLAHARTVDRMTPEGKKILHVEEMQSDWHQAGRDKGYHDPEKLAQAEATINALKAEHKRLGEVKALAKTPEEREAISEQRLAIMDQIRDATIMPSDHVPDAPFKKNWEEMVSKDLVKHAVDNGYDGITLTNGETQADRYNLGKYINELHLSGTDLVGYDHNGNTVIKQTGVTPKNLNQYVGKKAAKKLLDQPQQGTLRSLTGEDLYLGEGMKEAYDKRLPNVFNDIGKPYGAEMKLNAMPVRTPKNTDLSITDMLQHTNTPEQTWLDMPFEQKEKMMDDFATAQNNKTTPLHYMEFTPEMKQGVGENSLPAYADGGQVAQPRHESFLNPSLRLANGQVTLNPLEFMPNYQRGGKVHVADDLEMMRHEIHMSEGGVMTDAVLKKMGDFIKKSSKESFLPLNLKRAKSPNDQEMMKIAEPVIRQMTGEHVVPEGSTKKVNLAGRSMKESQRLKDLPYSLTTKEPTGKPDIYTPKIGDVNIAFPGDQTISDSILHSVGDIEGIDSEQEGGAKYGLGKLHLKLPNFWASGEDPAQSAQDKINRLAGYYDPDRVIAQHLAMGPTSNNFAMHLADANLRATDFSKMTPEQMYSFDNIIANGFVKKNAKTGEYEHFNFPHWPGIADPEGAYKAMQKDSELRKWYNSRMKTPEITSAHGLPNGLDIQWAITEPSLRNMQINMTGLSAGEVVPGAELTDTADHNTYEKGIRGLALQPITPPKPVQITFPDATQHILDTKRAQDFTGTLQKVFPHQVVDDQYLNDVGRYDALIKKYTGQKKGGKVKAKKANKKAKVEITNNINIMRHELIDRG